MSRRLLIIVGCALVLSVCISYLAYMAVVARAHDERPAPARRIVVAARDLQVGSLIRGMDVKTAAWPGTVPKGAITTADAILNRGVISPIYEGEPVTEARLALPGSSGGLAGTIPPGMRACAVKVNEVVGVAGFVVPGMRVDVLITGQAPGGSAFEGPRVRTLLQNIQVLSAGTNFQRDQEGKPEQAQVVSLLVSPPQAEMLSLAGNETRIQLVLRNPMDTQILRPPGTMVSNLFGGARGPEPVQSSHAPAGNKIVQGTELPATRPLSAPPIPSVVQVLNGSVHSETKFSAGQGQQ
jgi:pilus assembly protein CpaB